MSLRNPRHTMSGLQREQLRQASKPIGDVAATRRELDEISEQLKALATQRTAARRQYETDSHIAGGKFVTDGMREAARKSAAVPLTEAEERIRRETAILNQRAQSIVAQLNEIAETPSLASLPTETLGTASQMIPILEAQLSGLTLGQLTQRLRAAQVRADQGELFACATVARAHLAERQATPRPGDNDHDYYTAHGIVNGIQGAFRDDSLDPVITHAGSVVDEVSTFDHQIITDKSERGETDPYGFLNEGAA